MSDVLKKVVLCLSTIASFVVCSYSSSSFEHGTISGGLECLYGRDQLFLGNFTSFNVLYSANSDVYLRAHFDMSVSRVDGISLRAFDMVRLKRGSSFGFSGTPIESSDYKSFVQYFNSVFFQTFPMFDNGESVKRSILDLNVAVGSREILLDEKINKNLKDGCTKVFRGFVIGVIRDTIETDSSRISSAFLMPSENLREDRIKRNACTRQGVVDLPDAEKLGGLKKGEALSEDDSKFPDTKFACVFGSISRALLVCPYFGVCWDAITHRGDIVGVFSMTNGVSLLGISHYIFQTNTFDFKKSVLVEKKDKSPAIVEWRLSPKIHDNIISSGQFLAGLVSNISIGVGIKMSSEMYVGIHASCKVNLLIENVRISDMKDFDKDKKYYVCNSMHKYKEIFSASTDLAYLNNMVNESSNVFMLYRKRFCSPFNSISYKLGIHCVYNI